ncbi:TolC family protein [uncultured Campylobacter sp.]|uniref:TolC family protein n=1 Tax=uncultured Campylobacter sp. TaxID=218934 RepID=UPI002621B43C|nr:TolC family protein [uncultured Campylobacter sp.]
MKIKILSLLAAPILLSAQSASLSQAYNMALGNDEEYKYYMYNSLAGEQRYNQALSQLLPTINGDLSYHGDKYKRFNKNSNESYTSYGVTLRQPIFQPSLYYQRQQEELRMQGSHIELEHSRQELAKKVAKAYFELAYANANLKLALSYQDAHKAKFEQMERSLSLGLTNKMDMLESKVRYDESMLGVSKAQRSIDIAKMSLFKLVGQDIDTMEYFENINIDFFKNLDLIKYSDIEQNLDYRQSALVTQIAEKEHTKRKSEHLPTIDFSIGYSNNDYKDDRAFGDKNHRVETNIRLNMPIFSSWYTSYRVEEGMFLRQASISRQNDTRKNVDIAQRQATINLQNYIQEYDINARSLEHANVYEHSIERGYEEGLKDLVDLLDAKARVHKIKNELIASARNVVLAYLELESLINDINEQSMSKLESAFN